MQFAVISPSDAALARPPLQRTEGAARIAFRNDCGVTRLDRLFQQGALKIRLPRVPAGDPPTAVLINTAGGLTGGDRVSVEMTAGAGCRVIVTGQACEKIYRARDGEARVHAEIKVADGARIDWIPQETILFDGARLARRLDVALAPDATLLIAEAIVFGRTARGEEVRHGLLTDSWRIRRGEKLVFADEIRFDWQDAGLLGRPAVLAGGRAIATILFVAPEAERHLEKLRAIVGPAGGASAWDGKLLARFVAADGAALRQVLVPAITLLLEGATLPKTWGL